MEKFIYNEELSNNKLVTVIGKVVNLNLLNVKNNVKTLYGSLITHDDNNKIRFIGFNADNINIFLKNKNINPIENNDIIKLQGYLIEKQAEKDGILLYNKDEQPIFNYKLKGVSKVKIIKRNESIVITDFIEEENE